jgi:hypothetical protein
VGGRLLDLLPDQWDSPIVLASVYFWNGGFPISCTPVTVGADDSVFWGRAGTVNPTNSSQLDFTEADIPWGNTFTDPSKEDAQVSLQCWLPTNSRINLVRTF